VIHVHRESNYLAKSANRIVVATAFGVALVILAGIVWWLVMVPSTFPTSTLGYGLFILETLSSGILFAYSFVPALLPDILLTRKASEGAIAGFITYLFVAIVATINFVSYPQPEYCHFCGAAYIIFALMPFLGAGAGGLGGAIGAWIVGRH
jgi:hypothetical protein